MTVRWRSTRSGDETVDIVRVAEPAGLPIFDHFRQRTNMRCQHGQADSQFLTTFRINRLSMPGGIFINRDGGNHYSFAKLDYAAEDADYQNAHLRSDSEFRLNDNSVVESVDEYGDGASVQILTTGDEIDEPPGPRHGLACPGHLSRYVLE